MCRSRAQVERKIRQYVRILLRQTDRMSEVWMGVQGESLMLRVEDREHDESVRNLEAVVQVPGLEARRQIYVRGVDDLVAYFVDMAEAGRVATALELQPGEQTDGASSGHAPLP
jgi:hypothetical protein